jgi:fumarate reductase flavoprotein subunit
MSHLGADNVRRQFKGMVERCADCGFDLAGGLIEVVPTAHYMMGGVVFAPDCTTALPGLFAAGEDTGGVHGANRLGGNGVANSTVFGGIAGDSIAAWFRSQRIGADPDSDAIAAAIDACEQAFRPPRGDLEMIRDGLYDVMWNDVGILRSASGLTHAIDRLADLDSALDRTGVADGNRAFNLAWHDWLNLKSLVAVSRVIGRAALAREESRGAHFREDFPAAGALAASTYTVARTIDREVAVTHEPVRFTRMTPPAPR